MDSSCSFMFFNNNGDATSLMVYNKTDFEEALELAQDIGVPELVLESLKNQQCFPHTDKKNGYVILEANEWSNVLVDVKPIPQTNLYYALIKRPNMKALSVDRYFKEVWPKKS